MDPVAHEVGLGISVPSQNDRGGGGRSDEKREAANEAEGKEAFQSQ
jgi:hypothetical protein